MAGSSARTSGITTTIGPAARFSPLFSGAGSMPDASKSGRTLMAFSHRSAICSDCPSHQGHQLRRGCELAYFGAKVLHPATVLPAIQKNISVYVLKLAHQPARNHAHHNSRSAEQNIFKASCEKRITIVDVAALVCCLLMDSCARF